MIAMTHMSYLRGFGPVLLPSKPLLIITASAFVFALSAAAQQTAPPADGRAWPAAVSTLSGASEVGPLSIDRLRRGARPVLLLDVRSSEEFAVSHIPGALRIDTTMSPEALRALLRSKVRGAHVVLYCTNGARSFSLAETLAPVLLASGARTVQNMKGGVIAWSNADLALADDKGTTTFVHTYDATQATALLHPEYARFTPRR
jgi:rhodanese-related sulfurtransferase